jgi:hypothetical protein
MTRIIISLFFIAVILSGCGSAKTKLTASMSREGHQPQPYQKLAVLVMSPKLNNRAIVEQDLAITFATKGIKSIPTYDIFPFAGDSQLREQLTKDRFKNPEEVHAYVRKRIYDNNIDALLIISVFDVAKEERYVGGSSISVGVSAPAAGGTGPGLNPAGYPYLDPNVPAYQHNFTGYYYYAYSTVYESGGYYETTTTFFLETNLYDIETEQLIWTGQITTTPQSVNEESQVFATMVVDEIMNKGVIKP